MDSDSVPVNNDRVQADENSRTPLTLSDVAVVAIGRNEGERFKACVQSLADARYAAMPKIYVDSGSDDGSIEYAQKHGWVTVDLDLTVPFTAARARNAGVALCRERFPCIRAVMFVDGDCTLSSEWLSEGCELLNAKPEVVAVAGQRLERFPDQSVYNQLCQMEWSTPEGQVDYVGGDALVRLEPLVEVGGFDSTIIAGEEPDLYLRMRAKGGVVWCLAVPMTHHDAHIVHVRQWFKRVQRAGYAFARVRAKHRRHDRHFWRKEVRSIMFWGGLVPVLLVLGLFVHRGLMVGVGAVIALQWLRIARAEHRLARPYWYSLMCLIGKPVEMVGMLKCWWALKRGTKETLIEYKQ